MALPLLWRFEKIEIKSIDFIEFFLQ
jgi:hypothetical protein